MAKKGKNAISPTRAENYPEWYQQVVKAADLAEQSAVRGCMVIKPWGYALWENIQRQLDDMFKETGHENAYFPLLIPLSYLAKEAEHVDGFAKECAVVTHHRLVADGKGGLKPASPLDEPLVIRPTSETIIGETYAKWVQSYRDLPILINQWANVMRWEMRTRLFLRTSEFLWQEGHTVHATEEEAREETLRMLDVYATFAEEYMAMPVIKGEKTSDERFPGAVSTYTIEAMMQDFKALQSGTSHYLGQNFAKASGIKFLDRNEQEQFAYTTSWGVSTRLVGGIIMTHSDDDGLMLPPRLAPRHVVIIPIFRNEEDEKNVLEYCKKLQESLQEIRYDDKPIRVKIDKRDLGGGVRAWEHIKKGVPIRLEVGPRDIANDAVFMGRRDKSPKEKESMSRSDFLNQAAGILKEIQDSLFNRAKSLRDENMTDIDNKEDFAAFYKGDKNVGFVRCYAADDPGMVEAAKASRVTARCIPIEHDDAPGTCIFTGKPAKQRIIFGRSY